MRNSIVAQVATNENGPQNATVIVRLAAVLLISVATHGCRERAESKPTIRSDPAIIQGGSMAPTLLGEHFECRCSGCGFDFQFDVESAPKDHAICPNCGFANNEINNWTRSPAVEMFVESTKVSVDFRRFDVVAFNYPERTAEFGIKRIVGLPGEQIVIRDGDIFCDGTIVRKDFELQKEMSILVFDSRLRSANASTPRLVVAVPNSCWTESASSLVFDGTKMQGNRPESITYEHIRGYRSRGKSTFSDAVEDFYAYNQTKVRALNRVRDLAVELQVDIQDAAGLAIEFSHLEELVRAEFLVGLDSKNALQIRVTKGHSLVQEAVVQTESQSELNLYCSVVDQQVLVEANGRSVIQRELDVPLSSKAAHSPVSLIGVEGNFSIDRFRLFRDIYYLGPGNESTPWESAGSGYMLLGDNVPISIDSRHWEVSRMESDHIIGRATKK